MEGNGCDITHLDSDVLLPPRKRLLAGLKKLNSEITSQCPQAVSSSSPLIGFDGRINDLIKSCKNGSSMSLEEIAESAGLAAAAAAKAASVARAALDEKSAIAAKAVAAAKGALDLVASFSEEARIRERNHRKNKLKKRVQVQLLCKEKQSVENCGADEDLSRKLHQSMNKKNHKHKKLKVSPESEEDRTPNGALLKGQKFPSAHTGDTSPGEVDSEGSHEDSYIVKFEDKDSKSSISGLIEDDSREAESRHSKGKHFEASEEVYINGRKRGRIKQKKLPLSICSFKDQAKPISSMQGGSTPDKPTGNALPSSSLESRTDGILPIKATPAWKCQDFKVP